MKLNRETAQTEPMGPEKLEVERLYILPAFKGKKLGTQLLELAEELVNLVKSTVARCLGTQ